MGYGIGGYGGGGFTGKLDFPTGPEWSRLAPEDERVRDWPRYSGGRYAPAEQEARSEHRGVWGLECPGLWGSRNYE